MSQWEGEWPWLRHSVSSVRKYVWAAAAYLGPALNVSGHVATAKLYAEQADRFVAVPVSAVGETVRTKQWVIPSLGIGAASAFITAKSASWGTYRAMRNGGVTAVALTVLLFPREIISWADASLPFRVQHPKADIEDD